MVKKLLDIFFCRTRDRNGMTSSDPAIVQGASTADVGRLEATMQYA